MRWAVLAPYDVWFVDTVKHEIPRRARVWIAALKMWFFDEEHVDTVRKAVFKVYGTTSPCAECWAGPPCQTMEEIAAQAAKENLGDLLVHAKRPPPPPPPSEPKPPPAVPAKPEHVVDRAARLLGIKWGASDEEIKAAARRKASEVHPDKPGGSHELMLEVLAARDLLLGKK